MTGASIDAWDPLEEGAWIRLSLISSRESAHLQQKRHVSLPSPPIILLAVYAHLQQKRHVARRRREQHSEARGQCACDTRRVLDVRVRAARGSRDEREGARVMLRG